MDLLHRLRSMPIKRKVMSVTMLTSGTALMLASLSFLVYESWAYRAAMAADLASTAGMLSNNSTAALAFDDPISAKSTLMALRSDPNVMGAALYDLDGKIVATYRRAVPKTEFTPPAVEPPGSRFEKGALRLFRSVDLVGERIGMLYLQSDVQEMYARLWRYVLVVVLIVVVASVVALLLSIWLQASISEPISSLAAAVGVVAAQKDYSIRVEGEGDDELGQLIDGFNHMLEEIEKRDAELQRGRSELELRVEERTRELQVEVRERQGSEAALRASNQRFEIVIKATTNVIWDWDFLTDTIAWNENFRGVFGQPSDDATTTFASWSERIHPEDASAVLAGIHAVVEGGGDLWSAEYRLRRPDGAYAFVFDRGCVVRDDRGRAVRMIGALEDFTDRRRAQEELGRTHQQLLEASRRAGMAEVATNVLHNVGNVLNSLNVSASLVSDYVKKLKVEGLARVGTLLAEHRDDLAAFCRDDPRGRQVPPYLSQLAEHLAADQKATILEIASLRGNIDHIKEIVAMQQSYAKVSGFMETVSVTGLVDDSLRMNGAALERHGVEVVRDYSPVPQLNLDKHKVLQILINLIRNAKYACEESQRSDKCITLRVEPVDGWVRISVIDNGVGIAPENGARIFSHGFTTRRSGHGFGLHSGALAAQEMGGSLQAFSEGPGRGATFTLDLPCNQPEVRI